MPNPRPITLPTQPATREILVGTGMTPAMIRTQLGSGALRRVRRGVYLAESSWPEDARAQHVVRGHAEQVVHPSAVLSHETAAAIWRLPHPGVGEWHEGPPSVTVLAEGARFHSGPGIHHVGVLPNDQVTRDPEGYAVTTVARTAVDVAEGRDLPDALVLLDAAARRLVAGMVAAPRRRDYANAHVNQAARDLMAAAAAVRHTGLGRAVAMANAARESPAESLSAAHILMAGLPEPLYQHKITTPAGTFYPDFYWPELRLVGEVDGAVKYGDSTAYVSEKAREQSLRDEGYRIVRWLASEIMLRPEIVIDRIARALGL